MPDKEFGIPLGAGESIINYRACSETSFFIIFMVGRNYFVSSVMKSMAEASWGICVSLSQGGGGLELQGFGQNLASRGRG